MVLCLYLFLFIIFILVCLFQEFIDIASSVLYILVSLFRFSYNVCNIYVFNLSYSNTIFILDLNMLILVMRDLIYLYNTY